MDAKRASPLGIHERSCSAQDETAGRVAKGHSAPLGILPPLDLNADAVHQVCVPATVQVGAIAVPVLM